MKKMNSFILVLITLCIVTVLVLAFAEINPTLSTEKKINNQIGTKPAVVQTPTLIVNQDYLEKPPVHLSNISNLVAVKIDYKTVATLVCSKDTRTETGIGKSLNFKTGETVCGYQLYINGKTYFNQVIKDSPMDGTVTNGVIWPWPQETANMSVVDNNDITGIIINPIPEPTPKPIISNHIRFETGRGKSLYFQIGDTVCGY